MNTLAVNAALGALDGDWAAVAANFTEMDPAELAALARAVERLGLEAHRELARR